MRHFLKVPPALTAFTNRSSMVKMFKCNIFLCMRHFLMWGQSSGTVCQTSIWLRFDSHVSPAGRTKVFILWGKVGPARREMTVPVNKVIQDVDKIKIKLRATWLKISAFGRHYCGLDDFRVTWLYTDCAITKPGHRSSRANFLFLMYYRSPGFVRLARQGSSGRRVALASGTTFLRINVASTRPYMGQHKQLDYWVCKFYWWLRSVWL